MQAHERSSASILPENSARYDTLKTPEDSDDQR